eukprot:3648187-Pyramimonas_sp.AAC.1
MDVLASQGWVSCGRFLVDWRPLYTVGPRYKIEVDSWRVPYCSPCLLDVLVHPGEGTLGCSVRFGPRR